jgi:rhodanese-related sulfurtransferase
MFEAVSRRAEIPDNRPTAVLCAGGLRSSAVIGALQRHGLGALHNVTAGMGAWIKAGYSVTRAICAWCSTRCRSSSKNNRQ